MGHALVDIELHRLTRPIERLIDLAKNLRRQRIAFAVVDTDRGDLVLQFVVENVVLCLLGGVLGLIGAYLVLRSATFIPQVPILEVHLSWRIFLSAFVLATIFGLLSGVWPAWKMSRQNPVSALKGGGS